MINENMCSVERNEVAWNRQEAREGFWSEHHDLLSCRAWCRETHRIAATRRAAATRRRGAEKHTKLVLQEGVLGRGCAEKHTRLLDI